MIERRKLGPSQVRCIRVGNVGRGDGCGVVIHPSDDARESGRRFDRAAKTRRVEPLNSRLDRRRDTHPYSSALPRAAVS